MFILIYGTSLVVLMNRRGKCYKRKKKTRKRLTTLYENDKIIRLGEENQYGGSKEENL